MKASRPPEESGDVPVGRAREAHDSLRERRSWDPVVAVILGSACVYVAWLMDRAWIPHDDGLLAQTAERILLGERSHTDFQDPYTGALAYWHALALRLFGVHLLSLRVMLFLSSLPFLAATYAVLRRFLRPRWAAVATAGALVWGLPSYPASMPTWYNLFLATLALLAFFRFLESGRHGWLFWAGAAAGVSTLFKLVGVFSLAGLLLALFFCSSWVGRPSGGVPGRSRWGSLLASGGALVYTLLLVRLVLSGGATVAQLFHYLLPGIGLGLGVMAANWLGPAGGEAGGVLLWRRTLALATGFAIPIGMFALPYAVSGSLADLWHGVVVLPQRRLAFASGQPFPLRMLLPSLPLFLIAGVAVRGPERWREPALRVLSALLGSVLLLGSVDLAFGAAWYGLRALPTLLVVIGLVAVAVRVRQVGDGGVPDRPVLMAASVFAMLGTFSMVQFPFTGPVYFFYVAPLLPLAGAAVLALTSGPSPRRLMVAVLSFGMLFGVTWVNRASILGENPGIGRGQGGLRRAGGHGPGGDQELLHLRDARRARGVLSFRPAQSHAGVLRLLRRGSGQNRPDAPNPRTGRRQRGGLEHGAEVLASAPAPPRRGVGGTLQFGPDGGTVHRSLELTGSSSSVITLPPGSSALPPSWRISGRTSM